MVDRLPLDSPAWARLVGRFPGAMPFHHPGWATAIANCYRFEAFGLALRGTREGEPEHVAGVPVIELRNPLTRRRRWSSLPYTDTCPPLVAPGDEERLAAGLDNARRRAGIAEVEISGALIGAPGVTSALRVLHVLALDPDPEVVARSFRSSVRRNVRAAQKAGLRLRRGTSEADVVDVFYPLQVMTRRRLGLPVQPLRFFRSIWRAMLAPGLGHLTIVESAGTPVAAAVFLDWHGARVYKYGASDPRAWHLRPNNLVFAEEIAEACAGGRSTFHFGRTDVADEGLRRFKLGWGAHEEPLVATWFGRSAPAEGAGPPELVRSVVRRSPAVVARVLGGALYRYVA